MTELEFQCDGRTVRLPAGGIFRREVGAHFRDTSENAIRAVIERIDAGEPWRDAVASAFAGSRPWLHRIISDPARDRFFREVRPCRNQSILDVGAGWGQQTLRLAADNRVCAVEPGPDRIDFIRAVARQSGTASRIHFVQANLQDVTFPAQFDVVTCIGVLEWAANFRADGDPRESQEKFLVALRGVLRPGGVCVIGIENRLGLKYLLGSRDDHTGQAGISVFDHELARRRWRERHGSELRAFTYTMAEYGAMLAGAGFARTEFHAAFPDYKVPGVILPAQPGSTVDEFFLHGGYEAEHDGFDGTELPPEFQEALRSHYASLADLGVASRFAPSYFILAHV